MSEAAAVDTALGARPSGLLAVGELPWSTHLCHFYRTREDLLETLVPFFAAGLRADERCLWITAEPLLATDATEALRLAVPDLDERIARGQIDIFDQQDWYLRLNQPVSNDVLQAWLDHDDTSCGNGYEGWRISGNTSWLERKDWVGFAAYEASVNAVFHSRRVIAVCSYLLTRWSADKALDVLRNHASALVRRSHGWELTRSATMVLASIDPATAPVTSERDTIPPPPAVPNLAPSHGATLDAGWGEGAEWGDELQRLSAVLEQERAQRKRVERKRKRLEEELRAERLRARMATEQLFRLQALTSALSEAKTLAEIDQVVSRDLARAIGADTASVSLAGDHGDAPDHTNGDAQHWMPLRSGGRALGAICVQYATDQARPAWERALLDDCARQVALAVDRALAYERADAGNRAKDEFLAMLSHELRNPLSPILTAVQLMQLRPHRAYARERTVIERQVNHMVRLVDDLLDVSRIARGKVQLKTECLEISSIAADAIECASPLLEARGHQLTTSIPATGLCVEGDRHRLAQVISNLLTNAAKYTPLKGCIQLAATRVDASVALRVSDNGVGIDPPLLTSLFDLFVQGRQSSDRALGGLGLGLAIARNLAELHGGKLTADSAGLGQGSTFTLQLPLTAGSGSTSQTCSPTLPNTLVRRGRILIVDDNQDAAETLASALETLGHDVAVAHDAPSALQLANNLVPEVALLDIGLPVMDGYELGQRLQAMQAPPVLIAVTGYGHEVDRKRSKTAGFSEHLVKPVDLGNLQAVLGRLLQP